MAIVYLMSRYSANLSSLLRELDEEGLRVIGWEERVGNNGIDVYAQTQCPGAELSPATKDNLQQKQSRRDEKERPRL